MTEKYIPYKYNGEIYDIPESKSAEFEKHYPSATIEMHMDGEIYDIPLAHKQEAIDKYGSKLTYAFEKDSENTSSSDSVTEEEDTVESLKPTGPTFSFSGFSPIGAQTRSEDTKETKVVTAKNKDEGPSVGESFVKGAGAGFTRTGKGLLGALHWLSSGYTYNDPETGEAKRTEDYDTQMRDETNTLRNAYVLAGETADRLSKEADPTGGEKGFVDLISEGKLGTALQKGVATMAESLPMTLSAYNPYTMALNFVSMAADNYGEETLENPDMDPWKRGVYAIGTAAFEQAVEKFADPVFKYIGGGKGAGKITEEMAKEIMEKGTKDAVKNIAQRIFQALGRGTVKTLKDAGGEGLEEIVTSLGTDALGSALDAIDGNDDYGFSAQWKQYNAEHPNADKKDFAEKKAKEYVDAFLGGALSGGYMSGSLNVANEASMQIGDYKNRNQMTAAREKGTTLTLANMYDLNDVTNEQVDNAANSLLNENGESMLSREFINSLSSEEAYALSRSESLSIQQRTAFQQLANAKAMQEGLRSKLDSDLENNVNAQKILIEHVADNGNVVAGFVNGQRVYVKGGVEKNGVITLPNGENGPVIVINALTGEQTTINSNEIQEGVSQSAEEYSTWVEGMLRENDARNREIASNTMSPRAKLKAVTPYVGKKMYIDLGGGVIEVGIQNVSPESGKVLVKGKKGDLGGQAIVELDASVFYDSIHRDDDGNPMLAEGEVEVVDEIPVVEEAPVADVTGDEDFREQNVTILIDGVPTNVYVTSQDNTSDSIVYEYEDANGNKKSGSSTVGAFKGAMQQAEEYKPEEPTAIEGVETDVETPSVPEEPAPVETAPQEVPVTPETIDWDMLFDNDPETFFTELQNQFGEDTADVINDFIATAEEELASLEKKKGKTMNDRIKDLQRKSSLKLRIGTLYNMLDRLKSKSEPVVATSADTPAEKEEGFIFEDGDVKNPLVLEMPDEEGTTNKIFLAEKDGKWGSAAYVVLDDGNESGTPRIQIQTLKYDTKEDAIKAALSYFDFYKNMKKDSPSTKTDAFVQYIKDTYLPKEATAESDITAPTETEANVETPAPVQQAPVAPTKVADPIRESQKKEKHLATQLKRYDLSPEQKQDMAFNVGKSVADMFATREEYEAYAENATDLGDYYADFERGVDESFANRQQNVSDSPVNSVPLESESNGDSNGEQSKMGSGQHIDGGVRGTSDGEGQGADKANTKEEGPKPQSKNNKGKSGKKVAEKYPARKGNATQKLLVDTFGFNKVEIPNSRKETLNTIYDFMMAMSKMLGISPKSIGQGGWLDVASLRSNSAASAEHSLLSKTIDQSVVKATLKYKYSKLSGLAHEWWHALDHALSYFETGKGKVVASEIAGSRFTGRKETWEAVQQVIKAIKDSGHENRIYDLKLPRRYTTYLTEPSEMAARAFDEYIKAKFESAGITIDNSVDTNFVAQPTAEEMAIITPAFDNLFEVLQEKEGKTPGTSVLYHIGEMMDEDSDAKKLATDAVLTALDNYIEVEEVSDQQAENARKASGINDEFMVAPDNPVFVSNAALAVANIKQEKATPEQWLKMIEKAGGLKAGEDKWMGLSDWLKASDKKTLTKAEVLDFINENIIVIEEQHYSNKGVREEADRILNENYPGWEDAFSFDWDPFMEEPHSDIYDEVKAARLYNETHEDQVETDEDGDIVNDADYNKVEEFGAELAGIWYGRGKENTVREIHGTREEYTTNGLTNLHEIALTVPTIESWNESDDIHFGDAGEGRAVAWIRFGEAEVNVQDETQQRLNEIYDRLDELEMKVSSTGITEEEYNERARLRIERDELQEIKPKTQRVLVIDEIQSKRHQEGRERGYKVSKEKADAEMDKFMKRMHEKYDFSSSTPFAEVFNEEEMRELARLNMQQHRATFGTTSVPDAPFDKNWHELAMKRMLRYAAENGYDAIAWTKGDQQAERYNIGDVVTSVDYRLNNDGSYRVDTMGRDGYQMEGIPTTFNSEAELAEIFGKDIARKIAGNLENDKQAIAEADKEIDELREWFSKNTKTDEADLDSLFESAINNPEQSKRWNELEVKKEEARKGHTLSETDFRIGGEGMKGFYDKMLPAFMNKYGKKWGVKVEDIELPNLEEAGRVMHSVPVTDSMKDSVMDGQVMFMKRPNGKVYGWTDGKKIYLTKAGINPNTPVHEYTHLWAKAMMQKNHKGWNSIKSLLKGTPIWDEVINDPNYSDIKNNEDAVASEVLSRISGSENAAKLEKMAQQMIDEAKGTARKLEARGLIQNIKDALNKFWNWVGTELFGIENFESVEQVTDRVLWDLMNKTDLGELSEGQVETQIVTNPNVVAELESSPKRTGYRNVVQNEDGSFSSPMAYWLQSPKGGAKTRVETDKFELGKWEEAQENTDLVDERGHITLVKPNKGTLDVAYDPYIHNRLDPVNLQFKDAWKRDDLVYVETEVPETDLESGYHADKALLSVGVHSWSNGDVMLSRYDKPVRVMPWENVADAWAERLNGEGVHFDVVPPALRPLLVERGVEILPPHKGMGKDCNDAYKQWKDSISNENSVSLPNVSQAIEYGVWNDAALNELNKIAEDVEDGKAILKRYTSSELTGLLEGGRLLVGASIISRGSERNVSASRGRAKSLEEKASETIPAITAWAKSIGAWRDYSERSEEEIAHSYWTSGGEAQVFYLGNGKVEKIIGLDYFVDPQLAIDRIAIHNSLFEETQLRVTGFGTNKDGQFAIIVEQPTIIGKHTDNSEIDSYIESIGFKKVDDTTRTFANEDLYLSDLHEENVLNQNHERYYVIDGDFRLNTAELGVGGNREIDDSIVRVSNETESRKDDIQNAAVDFLVGPERNRVIERAVNEEAAKLGVKVTYKTRSEMPKGHENDKGYYNTKTGEIVICTENASSVADAIQTILHEAVAHKGLRQLMGDKFNEFISRVYDSLDAETKAKVDTLATEKYDGNTAVATEEYIASLAETEDFANNSLWDKIKSIFEDIINAILGRNDIKIGDNELRYILRASYANMVNPRNMDTIEGWAKDKVMREEYKINEATLEIMSRTGIDPTEIAKATAAEVYANHVSATWNEFQRQFQDAMQPVRVVYDAIQQETGNVPIEDYENYILVQNQSSSRSRVEIDNFQRKFYSPIIKQVNALIDKIMESRGWKLNDEKKRSEVYKEVRQYLIAKHGLERNKYYQEHKMRHLKPWEKQREIVVAQSELDAAVEAINSDTSLTDAERELQIRQAQDVYDAAVIEINEREIPDLRDYSGLTALFGMDEKQFEKAEEEAAALVENFEKDNAEMTEELWKRINKATDKTLRHSYECGLISRQQYNDIKGMFNFYIPLRGFDETTAEDVYSYARFEGNKFNPAVYKTGGRTSLADDPIAIIMNMAESEIAQGNKNRAKQALYNFILNRPIVDSEGNQKQNSLMQIENVWYVKNVDENGNEVYTIASPNHEDGETYEEFEARMQEKAEKGEAMQSKKGKVDVGMRFQKPSNANAHYIYLKVNGVEKAIYVNGDPKAAEAVNGTYKPKPIYQKGSFRTKYEKVNKAIEFAEDNLTMSNINRLISSTFTNYSLEFTVRNYFRDMVYSHINIDVREHDPAYRKKFRKNWRHNNLKSMVTMLKAYRAGEFEGRELNADEAAFVEFMENGGQTGYTLINSVETRKRDLERAIKKMQGLDKGGVKDSTIFRYTLGAVELLNEASELVTRFAAFKTSRDMGRSVVRSISDAKEITVNFNTKGAQDGKGIFGFLARYIGWSKYFFNASVQGVQNIAAMAKANKLKFCSVVGGMAAWGLLMPVIVGAISEMLGGDDDEYWNIPEYDRQNNFCVPVGNGMYAKIPLPIGFREMYALGDMVAAMAFDKKFSRNALEVGTDMANKIASIVLPINPLESTANGLSVWHTMAYTALPSSAQFIIQNMSNVDWKGSPLQKEYTYNENDPSWMKAFENNPAWMKGLSKWCNEHIDLNDDYKGMDWSPEKLDNTLSNLFGGIYTLIKKTGNSFSMIWNEENRNLSNVPMAGVFLGSGIDNDEKFVIDAYYEGKDYYDQRIGTIKRRAEQFGYELDDIFEKKKGKHHPKIQEIYANDNFKFMQEWYKGNKELEDLNKDIKKLELKVAEKENPSESLVMKLNKKKDKFLVERREFVNKMLEID